MSHVCPADLPTGAVKLNKKDWAPLQSAPRQYSEESHAAWTAKALGQAKAKFAKSMTTAAAAAHEGA